MAIPVETIPDWEPSGILPPFVGGPIAAEGRSPYHVGLRDLVLRFGDTDHRRRLLRGLLSYRARLHQAGLVKGFQWINGSFVENVERHSGRPPSDVDVVTFCHLPTGRTQQELDQSDPDLFSHPTIKDRYRIDTYPVFLDPDNLSWLVERVTYWNSLWSHRLNRQWKGYLEIDLADAEDQAASSILEQAANGDEQ